MQIIISPAKKMKSDVDSLPHKTLPPLIDAAETLLAQLQSMTDAQLQSLWQCNDAIAELNIRRVRQMNLRAAQTPAILAYEGIQYQYMAPGVFEDGQYQYLSDHLRILSGLYGILRPFDGVTPYRLEMQAKLPTASSADLYGFWGHRLADFLASEGDVLLNLASKEYSKAVLPHLPKKLQVITCTFAELQNGKPVEKGTLCKMARGEMVRWMAEHRVRTPAELRSFDRLQYRFSPAHSTATQLVFLKTAGTQTAEVRFT